MITPFLLIYFLRLSDLRSTFLAFFFALIFSFLRTFLAKAFLATFLRALPLTVIFLSFLHSANALDLICFTLAPIMAVLTFLHFLNALAPIAVTLNVMLLYTILAATVTFLSFF